MTPLLFLPGLSIHPPFYADTREPLSRITLHSAGIEAGIADELAVLGQDGVPLGDGGLDWRLGIAAGVFMGFDPAGELTFNLLTFDGMFGFPVDLRLDDWSLRLEWVHVSAHFADGVRFLDERPDMADASPYSREWVQLQLSRDLAWFRPYFGVREIVHAADGGYGWTLQAGWTADGDTPIGPYVAADLKMSEEDGWVPSTGGQAGVRFVGRHFFLLRFGVAAYHGIDDAGRWRPDRESYVGLHLSVHGERE